jgi:outer membrane murein-binding lipoprotein Lpp
MTSPKQIVRILVVAAAVSVALSSCSNKATEEQMKTLRELDQNRDGLKIDLDRAMATLRDAQGKLAAQDRELADCQQQTNAVREGLSKWPNIWPDETDWNPPPPPPPPEPAKTSKKGRK